MYVRNQLKLETILIRKNIHIAHNLPGHTSLSKDFWQFQLKINEDFNTVAKLAPKGSRTSYQILKRRSNSPQAPATRSTELLMKYLWGYTRGTKVHFKLPLMKYLWGQPHVLLKYETPSSATLFFLSSRAIQLLSKHGLAGYWKLIFPIFQSDGNWQLSID